ncbi:MAG: hypothetical protein H0X30_25600 [Anaerolineae bacterium]|nr:hypothetical protein [Anaerolineae bacterium]
MAKQANIESNLDYNRVGKFSNYQRFRMRMGIIVRGLIGLVPIGFLLIILYVIFVGRVRVDSSFLVMIGIMALVIWLVTVPAFRHVYRLASDLQGAGVAEDCGVLTLKVNSQSLRSGGVSTKSYIYVDGMRWYVWNSQIEGGFTNNDYGCVYFGHHSKLVLSIETFTKEQIEKF